MEWSLFDTFKTPAERYRFPWHHAQEARDSQVYRRAHPYLERDGCVPIGLEIPSDQQERIDVFMKTGEGLDDIKLHTQIDSPEYRHLIEVIQISGEPIPVAIDSPYSRHGGDISSKCLTGLANTNYSQFML